MSVEPDHQRDFLLREYQNLPQLIAHWDAHFWQKSMFFFAVESLLLTAMAFTFREIFLKGVPPTIQEFHCLIGLSLFNFWLCYVWFRTNRSNREFLDPLLTRARVIEHALAASSDVKTAEDRQTFTVQWQSLCEPPRDRHSSRRWENHLPTGFALSWVAALVTVAYISPERLNLCCAMCTVLLAVLTLVLVEVFHPRRSTRAE